MPTHCECGGELERLFPTGISTHYKCTGFHKTDNPKKDQILTKDKIEKLDKEQKLALTASLLEKQGVNLEK